MGKKSFDRKKTVRFMLVPGPEVEGKPSVQFKPVQNKKSKVSKKLRKEVISTFADIDQISINGKVMNQDEIPAYVLQQIRGRSDIVYNQIKPPQQEQQVGDLYEIQDGQGDEEYEEYEIKHQQLQQGIAEKYSDEEEEWVDDEDQEYIDVQEEEREQKLNFKVENKFNSKVQQFPTIEETKTVNIEGKEYQLTEKQIQMLETVIPDNYEEMDFGGLSIKKYNEDGLLMSEKQKYEKYLLSQQDKVVIVDSYQHVPSKPSNLIDNDLKTAQINADPSIKEVEQALNYDGQEEIYDQLQDDFFTKMIQMELKGNNKEETKKLQKKQNFKKDKKQVKQPESKVVKKQKVTHRQQIPQLTQKQLQQQLETAVYNFQNNIQEKKPKIQSSSDEQEPETQSRQNQSMNFTDLQKREQYIGNDGEMDWRCLTRKQKKQYMKTKVIQSFYDELRQRQVQQKMAGKANVKVEDLHLKKLIKHIPYEQDHVMQQALENDLKKQVHLSDPEEEIEYDSLSDQDDIVSFHQKTSIIASNLSVIVEPFKKPKKQKKNAESEETDLNSSKIKVVPQKRNKNQTPQERKERKNKLRDMKKLKKEQKKQFAQKFDKMQKQTFKKQNPNNPLSKVSYVKIY